MGMHVFWAWAPFFGPVHVFWSSPELFWDLGSKKNVGDLLVCFLDPVVFFLDLHVFVLDPGIVFSTTKLIVSELGFCFWTRAPASWTLPPEGGGNSIVIGARIGLDFFGPWRILFWHPYAFFWTWHRVGGS